MEEGNFKLKYFIFIKIEKITLYYYVMVIVNYKIYLKQFLMIYLDVLIYIIFYLYLKRSKILICTSTAKVEYALKILLLERGESKKRKAKFNQ